MPKFEANMNYIPPSPPSSMKQCNKSATVKFNMELLLTATTRKQSRSGATPYVIDNLAVVRHPMLSTISLWCDTLCYRFDLNVTHALTLLILLAI